MTDDPFAYEGTHGPGVYACRGCGAWLLSQEHDGYCAACSQPDSRAYDPAKWAGAIGGVLALSLRPEVLITADQAYPTARRAAGFALDYRGREQDAAS